MKKITSDKRIHVFYFIHDLTPFGAQRVALYTVKNLDKNKFSVTICSFWGEETLAAQFLKCEAEVIFLRARRYLDPSAWIRLVRFLFRMRPDIIQTNLPELSFPVRLMSIFLPRMQIIHVFHNPFSSEPIYWRFLNIMTLRLCDAVVFVSKGIIQEVAIKTPWLKSRFFVVQNGVEIDADSVADSYRMRGELGIEADEKAICCVGRLVTQKGQDILIKAVAKLVKEKRRIKLVLAGDGEMLQELKDMALQLGIADKTLFLGRRSDISRILCACDIYAAPSRWEGFNIALGEAMALGKPCIATDIPGHVDLLERDVTGISMPVQNVDAIAEGIIWLIDQPEKAQKMASAAKEKALTEFTSETMAKKYEKIYLDRTIVSSE